MPAIAMNDLARASILWGQRPLPEGAVMVGLLFEEERMGALLRLENGRYMIGRQGAMESLNQITADRAVRRAT